MSYYGPPGYGPPGYGPPGYGHPGYGPPGYGHPGYGHSGYGHSGYGHSGYGHPGYCGPQSSYPVQHQQPWCYEPVGPYCTALWCSNQRPYAPPAPLQQVVVETPGRYEEPTSFMKPHEDPPPHQTLDSLTSSEAVEESAILNSPDMETNGEEIGDVEAWRLLYDPYHEKAGYM